MNEFSYFNIRAQHHSRLALEASDPRLKAAHEAIAAHMSAKVATADPNRKVVLVDGVVVDSYWSPGRRPGGAVDVFGGRVPSSGSCRNARDAYVASGPAKRWHARRDLPPRPLTPVGFADHRLAHPAEWARYPVAVHRAAVVTSGARATTWRCHGGFSTAGPPKRFMEFPVKRC